MDIELETSKNPILEGFLKKDNETLSQIYRILAINAFDIINNSDLKNHNKDDILDVVQDTLVKIFQNYDSLNRQNEDDKTFLNYINLNLYENLDNWSREKYRKSPNESYVINKYFKENYVLNQVLREDDTEEMQLSKISYAIELLSEDSRKILKMFYFDNLSLEDIAKKLNISLKSAQVKKLRAMQRLKNLLKN